MVTHDKVIAAIGNFDGVHRGHRHLIDRTAALARRENAATGVVLFDPHPRRFFRPDDPPFLITTNADRDALLRAAGVDAIYPLTFDAPFTRLTPEAFVDDVLVRQLRLAGVVVGADFRFGSGRGGDVADLRRLGGAAGMAVEIVDLLAEAPSAEKFGSTAVRGAITAGDMALTAQMLGRRWTVAGVVEAGQQRGRMMGFPTANLTLGPLIHPRYGVYATRVRLGGAVHDAVSNFGRRPTVGSPEPLLETHLFDFRDDLYGREIIVEFVDFIRDERKFDGLDALKAQIAADCETARARLTQASAPPP